MEAPSPFIGAPDELDELELDDEAAPDELELEEAAPDELELELGIIMTPEELELDDTAPEELELEEAAPEEELELEPDEAAPDELEELEPAAPELELLDDELPVFVSSSGGVTAPPHAISADDKVDITNARIAVERTLRNSSLDMNEHSSFLEAPAINWVGQIPCSKTRELASPP